MNLVHNRWYLSFLVNKCPFLELARVEYLEHSARVGDLDLPGVRTNHYTAMVYYRSLLPGLCLQATLQGKKLVLFYQQDVSYVLGLGFNAAREYSFELDTREVEQCLIPEYLVSTNHREVEQLLDRKKAVHSEYTLLSNLITDPQDTPVLTDLIQELETLTSICARIESNFPEGVIILRSSSGQDVYLTLTRNENQLGKLHLSSGNLDLRGLNKASPRISCLRRSGGLAPPKKVSPPASPRSDKGLAGLARKGGEEEMITSPRPNQILSALIYAQTTRARFQSQLAPYVEIEEMYADKFNYILYLQNAPGYQLKRLSVRSKTITVSIQSQKSTSQILGSNAVAYTVPKVITKIKLKLK